MTFEYLGQMKDFFDVLEEDELFFLRDNPLPPFLKWPGGKAEELQLLFGYPNLFPPRFDRYFEPFAGGGAFWRWLQPRGSFFLNDNCTDLIHFYRCLQNRDIRFFDTLAVLESAWHKLRFFSDLSDKHVDDLFEGRVDTLVEDTMGLSGYAVGEGMMETMLKVFSEKMGRVRGGLGAVHRSDRQSNVESALKAAYYTHVREAYNKAPPGSIRIALFYFLREFSFSSMFRFNADGDFNVPYGGISYNRKLPEQRAINWASGDSRQLLKNTTFSVGDFEIFLETHAPGPQDFVFVDPPYDESFSTYDNKTFDQEDHERLAAWLTKSSASFVAVVKETPLMLKLYPERDGIRHWSYPKHYSVSFMDRNDQDTEHLVVFRVRTP